MGDRRQGDRRQTSVLQKQIAISLKELIYLCIIFVLIVTNIIVCKLVSKKNFNKGYEDGYLDGTTVGFDEYYYQDYNYIN